MNVPKTTLIILALAMCPWAQQARGEPLSTAISYQGQLKQNGQPVSGATALRFSLFDAATEGNLVAGPLVFDGSAGGLALVQVTGGLFNVELDFGPGAFSGGARWLEVAVPAPDGSGDTVLSPRQPVTAAPYALNVRGLNMDESGGLQMAGDIQTSGKVSASAFASNSPLILEAPKHTERARIDDITGHFGIGTPTPLARLHIGGTPGTDGLMFPDGTLQTTAATGGGSGFWAANGSHISNTNTGNVGIGATNPRARLHVTETFLGVLNSGLAGDLIVVEDGDAVLGLYSDASGISGSAISLGEVSGFGTLTDKWTMGRNTALGGKKLFFSFGPNADYLQNANVMMLGQGIGSTVEIVNNSVFGGRLDLVTTYTGKLEGSLGAVAFKDASGVRHGGMSYRVPSAGDGRLILSAGGADHVSILSNGNVGIGVTAPSAKLQVAGDSPTPVVSAFNNHNGGSGTAHAISGSIGLFMQNASSAAVVGENLSSGASGYGVWGIHAGGGAGVYGTTFGGAGVRGKTLGSGKAVEGVVADGASGFAGYFAGRSYFSENVGIGTTNPGARLAVTELGTEGLALFTQLGNGPGVTISIANSGSNNAALQVSTTGLAPALRVAGGAEIDLLQITGADLAEKFPASEEMKPGIVAEIDTDNPGMLRIARGAYNRRVAGVVSGANGLSAGAVLGNLPGSESAPPIALSGRVWVSCDASQSAIDVGDLLTTSDTPGHAMKVTDYARAQGAILGKAMTALSGGAGMVLVLVTLQ